MPSITVSLDDETFFKLVDLEKTLNKSRSEVVSEAIKQMVK